ncbi:Vps54-like protein-domain-containing protein [Phlebopus sp. FC_14]|nr:Vps54-like protein-domain-containing protein [Phlebopus sp. FC_14]
MSEHSSTPSGPASPVGPLPDLSHPTARPFRFNWDAASRRRGPGSVSETTEGRGGDYFATPPRIDIPNTSTVNLVPGALPHEWSSSMQGFNAISTVLNNPHKRQAPPKAHSSLPSILPAQLPRVKRKDFDSYLRGITPEWERFVRTTQSGRDPYVHGVNASRASSEIPLTPKTPPISKLLTPLNTVPSVFFDSDFDLGSSRIFNAVIGRQDGDEDTSDPSSLSYSLPLLERLSHHADTVEQHLVREISIRSTSFFAALTNLQDLQTESEECLNRITTLRGLLRDVDDKCAKRGLEIVRKENRLMNLETVCERSKQLGAVVDMTGVARGLVGAGQWGQALDVIESIQSLWEPPPADATLSPPASQRQLSRKGNTNVSHIPSTPEALGPEAVQCAIKRSIVGSIPLSSLNAFASLPAHLRALTMEITSSLTTDLINVLKLDLLECVQQEFRSFEPADHVNLTLKDRLRPLLHGLVRTKGMREATISWREVVTKEVREIIRRHVSSFDADDEDRSSDVMTSTLRSKTHAEFFATISQVYKNLLSGIERLQVQNGIVIDVLESQHASTLTLGLPSLQDELSDILFSTADLSNKLAAKVIGYRSEQHAQLDLPSFLAFFNESWDFVLGCEVVCRRVIVGLRGVILGQAKLFLQAFHQRQINQSAKLVEDEQWNQIEVHPPLQHLADVLVDSAVRDSPDLIIGGNTSLPSPATPSANSTAPSVPSSRVGKVNGSATSGSLPSKCLRVEERPFFCVSATGAVLGLLLDYLRLVVNLSMLNTDTMSRVIEFLKAFNSRTCQVVLGAGAMRSAGLKNITAKHLALASQSLSIMVVLIPYVRETFRRHLSSNQAVMLVEFDKLKRDFQEHQNEIHSKLIAIMGDRISAHVRTLQAVNWEIPKQGDSVNDYMELLVKETITLHKVLSRYLSAPIVEYVMSQVFAAINHRLSEEYSKIELQSQAAKDRMLADTRFLHQKLTVLKNIGAPTNMLETLVAEKSVPRNSGLSNHRAVTSPNERIKGLLSRMDGIKQDKPLPSPGRTAARASGATPLVDAGGDPDSVIPPPRGSSLDPGSLAGAADEECTLADGNGRNPSPVAGKDSESNDARGPE